MTKGSRRELSMLAAVCAGSLADRWSVAQPAHQKDYRMDSRRGVGDNHHRQSRADGVNRARPAHWKEM